MRLIPQQDSQHKAIKVIREGGIVVMPTDTLYGIVCSARDAGALERLRKIKSREPEKSFIVLIGSAEQAQVLGANAAEIKLARSHWPGAVSVVMPVKPLNSLISGSQSTVAFRVPKDVWLQTFLRATGPLVAPSANPAGEKPASNISEAKAYFGQAVDYYLEGGTLSGSPSRVIALDDEGRETTIRA